MTDENGVTPDAQQETTDITQIFLAGGLKIDARGDVKARCKTAATKGKWIVVEGLDGNEVDVNAPEAIAYIVHHDVVIQRRPVQPEAPTAGAPKPPADFRPVVMED